MHSIVSIITVPSFFLLPENFLKILERDAEARRVRRVEQEKMATGV